MPRAYVSLKDHAKGQTSEDAIVSWIAGKVATYKRLLGGVRFIDEVPKSASGKIQRKIIREWAKEDAKSFGQVRAKL